MQNSFCGCSTMVVPQPSKLVAWVRFPSPAPHSISKTTVCQQLSWIEHRPSKARVRGSNPFWHTIHFYEYMVGIVQWQSARLWLWKSWVQVPLLTPLINFKKWPPTIDIVLIFDYNGYRCQVNYTFTLLGCSQVVRHETLTLAFVGSNPAIPANNYDPLAQLVEHMTFNHGVPRSNRGWVTNMRMWRNWQTHQTQDLAGNHGGSSPLIRTK